MPRIPKPDNSVPTRARRPEPLPADYSDDISEANFKKLREISDKEVRDDEFELVDGPAW